MESLLPSTGMAAAGNTVMQGHVGSCSLGKPASTSTVRPGRRGWHLGGGAGRWLSGLPGVTEEEGAVRLSSLTFYHFPAVVAALPGRAAGPLLISSGSQSPGPALPAARWPGLVSQPVRLCPPALRLEALPHLLVMPTPNSTRPQQAVLKPLPSWSLCLSDDSHPILCRLLMPYYTGPKFFSFSLPD